ncbi:Fic family protein [Solitalea lacus]|uniref:Fic family protein n=1 Tax=Solitalea lacus TaxID=2911172 RepID=UPI001ED9F0AA|nr:Fic family protein [Solitalea lacus]UKJ06672.1 Fic family protein [Solitalea lacus]
MDKNTPLHLQEIIFSSSNAEKSRAISSLIKQGKLKKLAPRIYSPNLEDEEQSIIKRNLFKIIGHLYSGALLSHRSAFEYRPTTSGDIFLTYNYERRIKLPGVTLNMMAGPSALSDDLPFVDGLHVSGQARAILENLQTSRRPGPSSKILTLPEVEEKLEQIVKIQGEVGLNELRDRARELSGQLGMKKEFEKLDRLISAILTTKPSSILKSPIALARAFGQPFDAKRIELFENLFVTLKNTPTSPFSDPNVSNTAFKNFAFYEAYFSNFIEGTKFKLEEAMQIIETGRPMATRDEDSHDILGTYQIVSNRNEMKITPESPEHLLEILQYRHKIMLSARPSKKPGEFKDRNNRAGNTDFVDMELVRGTLIKGFEFYQGLNEPFAKAAYMMFLVSEVHPFLDGNGRLARVMMNAELLKTNQSKIIIPTVFREDYLGALRAVSRRNEPEKYIRMLLRAWKFSTTIAGEDMNRIYHVLKQSNAFEEGEDYILRIDGEQS